MLAIQHAQDFARSLRNPTLEPIDRSRIRTPRELQTLSGRGIHTFVVKSIRDAFPHLPATNSTISPPSYENKEISDLLTYLAEITATRRETPPMMIAPIALIPYRATASPAKSLRPVLVQLGLVTIHLRLEFPLEVLGFDDNDVAPSHILGPVLVFVRGRGPGDEFKPTFVLVAVFAFAVFVVPDSQRRGGWVTVGFVGSPVGSLAFGGAVLRCLAAGTSFDRSGTMANNTARRAGGLDLVEI